MSWPLLWALAALAPCAHAAASPDLGSGLSGNTAFEAEQPYVPEAEELMLLQLGAATSSGYTGIPVRYRQEDHVTSVASSETRAVQAFQNLAFADGEDCPATYLYDIPELWDFDEPMSSLAEHGWENFGGVKYSSECEEGIKSVNQYAMPLIMLYRLLTSQRCKLTKDPERADLFLVPYLPRPKMDNEWCRGKEGGIDPTPFLTHMNHRTAHKHLFLLGKGHMAMAPCTPWFIHPTNLLRRAIRVTYSMPARGYPAKGDLPTGYRELHMGYGPLDGSNLTLGVLADLMWHFDKNHEAFPHTYSAPYPATGVLGAMPLNEPWKRFRAPRRFLASYVGRTHGLYGMEVRQRIVEDCRKAGTPICLTTDVSDRCLDIFQKSEAYFCLEPGGDSPNRKSLWDSISLGCVPVLFSPHQQILAPWHWGHFRNTSSVYINREDYLSGKVDLFQTLKDIAASGQLDRLRQSIAAHGHSTQYSRSDYAGDGFERILIGAHHAAFRYEQLHPNLA